MQYKIKLITRCGCTQLLSLGISRPKHLTQEWRVPLVRERPHDLGLEIRSFEYAGEVTDGADTCFLLFREKE